MNLKEIHETDLMERYLQGRLSERDQQAFEERYLGDAEILAELERVEKLQQGLGDTVAAGYDSGFRPAKGPGAFFRSPQYAMAASILMLFSFGLSGMLYQQLQQRQPQAGPDLLPLVTGTRLNGSGPPPNVISPADTGRWLNVAVDRNRRDAAVFRATVYRETSQEPVRIWQVSGLQAGTGLPAGYEDMIAVNLPAAVLPAGDYRLLLEGSDSPNAGEEEFFDVSVTRFRVGN